MIGTIIGIIVFLVGACIYLWTNKREVENFGLLFVFIGFGVIVGSALTLLAR